MRQGRIRDDTKNTCPVTTSAVTASMNFFGPFCYDKAKAIHSEGQDHLMRTGDTPWCHSLVATICCLAAIPGYLLRAPISCIVAVCVCPLEMQKQAEASAPDEMLPASSPPAQRMG